MNGNERWRMKGWNKIKFEVKNGNQNQTSKLEIIFNLDELKLNMTLEIK